MKTGMEIQLTKTLFTHEGMRRLEYEVHIEPGEILGVFGPSGAGKSTLLRMIAGLTEPDNGSIVVDGRVWYDSIRKICLPVEERHVGIVFQDHNLFPNMTVEQNLRFSMRSGFPVTILDEILETLGLSELRKRKPSQLSGGQGQRVALARTLVNQPELLLLDEPFSSLDWTLRWRLQNDLLKWHQRFGCSTILVSHDLLELSRLAHRIHYLGNASLNPDEIEEAASLYQKMSNQLRTKSQESYLMVGKEQTTTSW